MFCLLQVNQGNWCQESYETASGDARKRVRELRKLGYIAKTSSLGMQVTRYGQVKLSLVDIRPGSHDDTGDLPLINT